MWTVIAILTVLVFALFATVVYLWRRIDDLEHTASNDRFWLNQLQRDVTKLKLMPQNQEPQYNPVIDPTPLTAEEHDWLARIMKAGEQ